MSSGFTLSRPERLRRSREFEAIYLRGRKVSGPYFTLYFSPNRLGINRLGLSVGKKRCKNSTQRHALQRRLREAYRLNKGRFLPGFDLVVVNHWAKKDGPGLAVLTGELLALAGKAGLLKT